MSRNLLSLTGLILFFITFSYAQYQNVWTFGMNVGITFNELSTNGLPTPIVTNMNVLEGSVSVCGDDGKLLFYSDGVCVYDRNHNLMPNAPLLNLRDWLTNNDCDNSSYVASTRSSSQTCIIIQYPGRQNLYYLFSLTGQTGGVPIGTDAEGRLYYSLIDMDLNGGLGDVVDTCNGKYIGNGFSEAISSVLGKGKIWLILPQRNMEGDNSSTHNIYTYPIDFNGFNNAPVVSRMPFRSEFSHAIMPNNSGSKCAYITSIRFVGADMKTYLLDFNKATGEVVSSILMNSISAKYGCCFSGNDHFLYTDQGWQYDIGNDLAVSVFSRDDPSDWAQIKMGPDRRIYFRTWRSYRPGGARPGPTLSVIHEPNLPGLACNVELDVIAFSSEKKGLGLPNVYNFINGRDTSYALCLKYGDTIRPQTNLDIFEVVWDDSIEADYLLATTNRSYVVDYVAYGGVYRDTIHVTVQYPYEIVVDNALFNCFSKDSNQAYVTYPQKSDTHEIYWMNENFDTLSTNDTVGHLPVGHYLVVIKEGDCVQYKNVEVRNGVYSFASKVQTEDECNGVGNGYTTVLLNAEERAVTQISWMNSNWDTLAIGKDTLYNLPSGGYYVHLKTLYCDTTMSFNIENKDYKVSYLSDTLLCAGNTLLVQNTSDTYYTNLNWYLNDSLVSQKTESWSLNFSNDGTYRLLLVGAGEYCVDSYSKEIIVDPQLSGIFTTSRDSICTGEKIDFTPDSNPQILSHEWQIGKYQFHNDGATPLSHSFEEAGQITINLTTQYRICEATEYTKSIYVFETPEVYLGNDSSICYQGNAITLHNLRTPPTNTTTAYQWSTGDTSKQLQIKTPGNYWLKETAQPIGCTGFGSIEICKDCFVDIPNAFTPNGDGMNDYFFPRKWLSSGVVKFHLQIFNRWGQLLYETHQTEGLGWDGKWNDKEQPMGVYIYRISVVHKNGASEHYEGNVTLVR